MALCNEMSFDLNMVSKAFRSFKGVKRRQEILSSHNNIWVIEDFAHHPTSVKMSIEAVKKRFSKVHALFEPRSATSRRKIFQDDYVDAFLKADSVWIAKPFDQEKIVESDRFSSQELVEALNTKGVKAQTFSNAYEILEPLKELVKPNEAILIMSNGSFDGIYQQIVDMSLNH